MAYVSVPKDLARVKSKVLLNLTARQVACFAIAAVMGLPFYFLAKDVLGTGNAGAGMVLLVLANMINVRLRRPAIRRYEVRNFYDVPDAGGYAACGKGGKVAGKKKQE